MKESFSDGPWIQQRAIISAMPQTTTETHEAKLEKCLTTCILLPVVHLWHCFPLRFCFTRKFESKTSHSLSLSLSEGLRVHSCKWHIFSSLVLFSSVAIEMLFCLLVDSFCVFTLFQCGFCVGQHTREETSNDDDWWCLDGLLLKVKCNFSALK